MLQRKKRVWQHLLFVLPSSNMAAVRVECVRCAYSGRPALYVTTHTDWKSAMGIMMRGLSSVLHDESPCLDGQLAWP